MLQSPPTYPPFDLAAQERIASLFRKCPLSEFIATLETFTPSSRDEQAAYEKHYGWALYEAGDYRNAREHLLRALRRSRRGSRDRTIIRGLLGECCLRTGRLESAERCAHRGLSQIPVEDHGHYLRAGHLSMLGRVYRRQGHLTHAVDTYRRALSLIDEGSSHWPALIANLGFALLIQGNTQEADALMRASRRPAHGRSPGIHDWALTTVEIHVALAFGDLDRAERAYAESYALYGDRHGERIWLVLMEHRATLCRARKDFSQSTRLLKTLLERCESGGRNGDMVACLARGLAESLEGEGLFEAALEPARLAMRAGSAEDRMEWITALHVAGRCLHALGRGDEALRTFQEAMSLHERTQFAAERARFRQTLQRLGHSAMAAELGDAAEPTSRRVAPEVLRARLADGRVFLTLDAHLVDHVRTAAASELPVLLDGETGTGKELVARLLHDLGPRAHFPFVVVDCTTLPDDRAEIELFGAARGAAAGQRERAGLIAQSDRGTLFLDELPALSSSLQSKLLRLLQEGTYRRVGEDSVRRVRLRVVAATNQSVEDLLKNAGLKRDLFYRLNGYRISLRPLRARPEEIGPLALEIARRCGLAGITGAALEMLQSSAWPGNVRQLEMALRVAAGQCAVGGWLERQHLESRQMEAGDATTEETLRAGRIAGERATLLRALEEHGGVISQAARSLGLSRQGFYKALRRTGLASV